MGLDISKNTLNQLTFDNAEQIISKLEQPAGHFKMAVSGQGKNSSEALRSALRTGRESEKEKIDLAKKNSELEKRNTELSENNSSLKVKIRKLEDDQVVSYKKIENKRKECESLKQQHSEAETRLSNEKNNKAQLESLVNELRGQVEGLKENIRNLQDSSIQAAQITIKKNDGTNLEQIRELQELQEELSDKQQALKLAQEYKENTELLYTDMEATAATLSSELEIAKRDVTRLESEVNSRDQKIDELQTKLNEEQGKIPKRVTDTIRNSVLTAAGIVSAGAGIAGVAGGLLSRSPSVSTPESPQLELEPIDELIQEVDDQLLQIPDAGFGDMSPGDLETFMDMLIDLEISLNEGLENIIEFDDDANFDYAKNKLEAKAAEVAARIAEIEKYM